VPVFALFADKKFDYFSSAISLPFLTLKFWLFYAVFNTQNPVISLSLLTVKNRPLLPFRQLNLCRFLPILTPKKLFSENLHVKFRSFAIFNSQNNYFRKLFTSNLSLLLFLTLEKSLIFYHF
jgi:hypothetical protein